MHIWATANVQHRWVVRRLSSAWCLRFFQVHYSVEEVSIMLCYPHLLTLSRNLRYFCMAMSFIQFTVEQWQVILCFGQCMANSYGIQRVNLEACRLPNFSWSSTTLVATVVRFRFVSASLAISASLLVPTYYMDLNFFIDVYTINQVLYSVIRWNSYSFL